MIEGDFITVKPNKYINLGSFVRNVGKYRGLPLRIDLKGPKSRSEPHGQCLRGIVGGHPQHASERFFTPFKCKVEKFGKYRYNHTENHYGNNR